jgi:hypothetical protein
MQNAGPSSRVTFFTLHLESRANFVQGINAPPAFCSPRLTQTRGGGGWGWYRLLNAHQLGSETVWVVPLLYRRNFHGKALLGTRSQTLDGHPKAAMKKRVIQD